jgi:hypothetical protein
MVHGLLNSLQQEVKGSRILEQDKQENALNANLPQG